MTKKMFDDITISKQTCINFIFIRKSIGLRQSDMAELLDVSEGHISNIEKCKRALTLDIALKLYYYYGISLDWLILNKGNPPNKIDLILKHDALKTKNLDQNGQGSVV